MEEKLTVEGEDFCHENVFDELEEPPGGGVVAVGDAPAAERRVELRGGADHLRSQPLELALIIQLPSGVRFHQLVEIQRLPPTTGSSAISPTGESFDQFGEIQRLSPITGRSGFFYPPDARRSPGCAGRGNRRRQQNGHLQVVIERTERKGQGRKRKCSADAREGAGLYRELSAL